MGIARRGLLAGSLSIAAIVLAVWAFGVLPGASRTPNASLTPDAVDESSSESSEGIQVHGHWTIEVLDPGGKLVSRHEFDNDLADGDRILKYFLARLGTPGEWEIVLSGPFGNQACNTFTRPRAACLIAEIGGITVA